MAETLITLDGSQGEGGGQVLRTSLTLAMCLGKAFKMHNIRANRRRPGLMRQHLTAVQAAARICDATVEGAELNSQQLYFKPGPVKAGQYHFAIGTAGSATLVLQTILLPLLLSNGPSKITVEGGTHNPLAPPYEFLQYAYLPVLEKMGAQLKAILERPGFFPAGGGRITLETQPLARFLPVQLNERSAIVAKKASILIAGLPLHIAERERKILQQKLAWQDDCFEINPLNAGYGPGNVVTLVVQYANVSAVFTGFGEKGVKAETVAAKAADEVSRFLAGEAPVEQHLSDQLLLPMALAGGGEYVTTAPSLHTLTNIEVIRQFIDLNIDIQPQGEHMVRIRLGD